MKTLEQWNAEGYRVLKGERSYVRNESGQALFDANQVWKRDYCERNFRRKSRYNDDEAAFERAAYGDDFGMSMGDFQC